MGFCIRVLYAPRQCWGWLVFYDFGDCAVDDALLSSAQGVDDADALVDLNGDGLFGNPAVGVLEDSKRGLCVARPGGVKQMLAILAFTVSAPLLFGQLGHLVKLFESVVLDW